MIEGLKVTVIGAELSELCAQRASHHHERANVYAAQVANMQESEFEGMKYTSGDPKRQLKDKQREHSNDAAELEFIAAHLVPDEQYWLTTADLQMLGITKARW